MPFVCTAHDFINKVKYSYSSGCNMEMSWEKKNAFGTQKDGGGCMDIVKASDSTNISISIQDNKVEFVADSNEGPAMILALLRMSNRPGGISGYLLNFTMWSLEDLQCDVQLIFPAGSISTKSRMLQKWSLPSFACK
uniref:Uncharacterized protein n=1 Tax=Ditylenchus dipsaci TaxID=166011 RepID=A0A915DUT6_9BILA